jgi:23S rRNA (uracil1939-C5)-methyltransferase
VSVSPRGREDQTQAVRLLPAEAGDLWGSAACFCQANAAQEANLRALVASLVPPGVMTALELHAGVGTLTVALAPLVEQLVAVESWAPSVALLRRNTEKLKVQVHEVTAEAMLTRGGASFDLVVLDPPREGVKGMAPLIAATDAGRVIYVSCDAMTLSRDARALAEHGYKPTSATALDMMPQTHHGELVVAFDR